jgi:hypothetical protein
MRKEQQGDNSLFSLLNPPGSGCRSSFPFSPFSLLQWYNDHGFVPGMAKGTRMTSHTIALSDQTYALLQQHAIRLKLTPEEVLERVLSGELALSAETIDNAAPLSEPEATAEALAAVQRLTTLFADVTIPNLDQVLDDPLLALANVNLRDRDS